MGRASRRRAEQRAAAGTRPPRATREHPALSAGGAAERPERYERVWQALARGPTRRSPYRRPPDNADSGLSRLRDLREARVDLDNKIVHEVRVLISMGTDWGTIGRALGASRQAVRQRFGTTT